MEKQAKITSKEQLEQVNDKELIEIVEHCIHDGKCDDCKMSYRVKCMGMVMHAIVTRFSQRLSE